MEIINITDEQRNELCDMLAKLTYKLKQYEGIDCIYFAPYKNYGKFYEDIFSVTVVLNSKNIKSIIDGSYHFFTEDSYRKLGIKVNIDISDSNCYSTSDLIPSICTNNLFNSTILFDRTGEYTRIKKQANPSNGYYYYSNLAEIQPRLTDRLENSMKELEKTIVKI